MRTIIITLLLWVFPVIALSQYTNLDKQKYGLAPEAVIIETRIFNNGKREREMVLWMISPKRNPSNLARDESYTCPDYTRGSYYSGPTRVSLYDHLTNKLINTIEIKGSEDNDSNDIPYKIRTGYYYQVITKDRKLEKKPVIINLVDLNGDGKAEEFVLFDAVACMGLGTTLIGYSEKQDRVIQYPIELKTKGRQLKLMWGDYLFSQKPVKPGYWKFEINYQGRGGTLDKYEVHYNSTLEKFEGTLDSIADE